MLGEARCLEALKLYAEAKQVYEDIITFHPGTGWAQMAETNLRLVSAKMQ